MNEQVSLGSQIKMFVGQGAHGVNGAEGMANSWLKNNPHITVKSVQVTAPGGGSVIVTVLFEGMASQP